jgi:hypothetical protein
MALWGSRDTFTIVGTARANSTVDTTTLIGVGTAFTANLEVGETFVLSGTTRKITAIANATHLTFEPAWTAANTAGAVTAQDTPKWLAANSATIQSSQFNGTQDIFGVDATEAVAETTDAGWIYVNEYTDMHGNPRKKNEVLVAMASITGDAEDAVFPDTVITITTQPISNTAAAFSAVSFTVATSTLPVGTTVNHRWQRAANANVAFADLTNAGTYSGANTATLSIANNSLATSGSIYRVQLSAAGVTANTVSANAVLTVA